MNNRARSVGKVKAAVLRWLGFGLTDYDQWAILSGRESETGQVVNPDKALTISAVWSCVRLVSQTIATLPLGMYTRQNGRGVYDPNHELNFSLAFMPEPGVSSVQFWECIVAAAMLRGNGFAEKLKIGQRIVGLRFFHPDRVTWVREPDGRYLYRYTEWDGSISEYRYGDLFHVPGFSECPPHGMSVIKYGVQVLGSALAANSAANSTFKNGLMPTTFFKFANWLTPQQREQTRENMDRVRGALNAGKQPLLEGGMDVGSIGINPEEAQLLESRSFSVEEVCRWFGVPPSMVGHTDKASSWASSAESLNLWFLQYGLRPWLKRIEAAILTQLVRPEQQMTHYAEFIVEGLLRADSNGRSNFYSTALQNGWMSRNEVRALENLPPVPGGDIYTAQSNLLPLDKLGEDNSSPALRAAIKHWLPEGTK